MTARTTRACDGCRFRKVRCNGTQPCTQCVHLGLKCVFLPAPARRKPCVRGRLVAQLRENAHGSGVKILHLTQWASGTASTKEPTNLNNSVINNDPSPPESASPVSGVRYTQDFFVGLLPEFEQLVYPVHPNISPDEMRAAIANMHLDYSDAALVYAFAAVTIDLTQAQSSADDATTTQVTDLCYKSLTAYRQAEMCGINIRSGRVGEIAVSIKRIVTCIMNAMVMMYFKHFDRSFLILREAIAMIQTLDIDNLSPGSATPERCYHVARYQRIYWEAYIHERFLCVTAGYRYVCILPPLRTADPSGDPATPPHVEMGFSCIIHLFLIVDSLLQHNQGAGWGPGQRAGSEITAAWVEDKQAQLDEDELGALEAERTLIASGGGPLSEVQHADLFITRLWLRMLVWQLALSSGLLCSAPPQESHEGLSLHFPAQRLSAELHGLVTRLGSVGSVETHGSGILRKLFDIISTIADVLTLPLLPTVQAESRKPVRAQMKNFVFLTDFLFSFKQIGKEQREYLQEKLYILQQAYTAVNNKHLADDKDLGFGRRTLWSIGCDA